MSKNRKLILKAILWISLCGLLSHTYAAENSKTLTKTNTTITSDRVEMESQEGINIFNFYGNVHLEGEGIDAVCDKLEVISKKIEGESSSSIGGINSFEKITGIGNVHITQEDKDVKAGHAVIYPMEGKVVLTENPQVTDSQGTVTGHKIIFYKNTGKAYVEGAPGGERPKIILPSMPDLKKNPEPVVQKVEKTEQKELPKKSASTK